MQNMGGVCRGAQGSESDVGRGSSRKPFRDAGKRGGPKSAHEAPSGSSRFPGTKIFEGRDYRKRKSPEPDALKSEGGKLQTLGRRGAEKKIQILHGGARGALAEIVEEGNQKNPILVSGGRDQHIVEAREKGG